MQENRRGMQAILGSGGQCLIRNSSSMVQYLSGTSRLRKLPPPHDKAEMPFVSSDASDRLLVLTSLLLCTHNIKGELYPKQ